jgi:Xaa-Pro aminopeptidase
MFKTSQWKKEAEIIAEVLKDAPSFDKEFRIPASEFKLRQEKVMQGLEKLGLECGIVYSNEQYNGDVPYLAGNTNVTVEAVAAIIGKKGCYLLAGLEGGYVAEQLAPRAGCEVHKVEMLKVADEDYPIDAVRIEDVLEMAVGHKPDRIGLMTSRAVFPLGFFEFLKDYFKGEENIVDAQEMYYRVKYEKSELEMQLTEEASKVASVMLKGMASVLRPGMYETQVAQWGYAIAAELGVEELGVNIIVNSNEANRTLIGKALNRKIQEGDFVQFGALPKRDGLNACERMSVICVKDPKQITQTQKFWFDFIEEAFDVALKAYKEVAAKNLPSRLAEKAAVDYFASRSADVSKMYGKKIDMSKQKPYTTFHNSGYTEYAEFFGAITLQSEEPLGERIIAMLDMAARGVGNKWDDVIIPGFDYIVLEKTLAKTGKDVRILNDLPQNIQHLVGRNF